MLYLTCASDQSIRESDIAVVAVVIVVEDVVLLVVVVVVENKMSRLITSYENGRVKSLPTESEESSDEEDA